MSSSRHNPQQYSYSQGSMMPQEEMLEIGKIKRNLNIGIPKEYDKYENRIILTPKAIAELIGDGHKIHIERGAGEGSNWTDDEYASAGAVLTSRNEVFKSEIVLKVSPFCIEEIKLMPGNQMLISALHTSAQTEQTITELIRRRMTAVAYELIKDNDGFYPFVHSMSEIAGILAITIAGEYLSNAQNGKGILLGGITGITPAEIVILGAGTAGEYTARAALGLGATVKVFDYSVGKLRDLQKSLGQQIFTSVFQKDVLLKNLKTADVVVGASEFSGKVRRFWVPEEMVRQMKRGSVIVDLNVDNEPNFETSVVTDFGKPAFTKHGVIHYCVPNIASRASRTASVSLSNALLPLVQKISQTTEIHHLIRECTGFRNGTYIYKGILTNEHLGNKFGIDYKDINLLTAVY